MSKRDVLLDVSRLIWRLWRGDLPTGVDRVCLAYLDHYASRSRAMIQRRGKMFILDERRSDRLFELLSRGSSGFRSSFLKFALTAFISAPSLPAERGLVYLNVGHTGLDEPSLGSWIRRAGVRAIFFIHDLIPILHPEYCRAGERNKHERRMVNALQNATGLILNSEATLADVRNFATTRGLPMPPSVTSWIAGPTIPAGVVATRLERPHFIVVGTIEARKNHQLLLHVWSDLIAEMGASAPLLIIAGQRGWEVETTTALLDRSDFRGKIKELGRCADEDLAALIAGARALLMPSFTEGFGLPVIEALELGTPVIASDLPAFREIAGDIPTYLNPFDMPSWKHEILSFVEDGIQRREQLKRISGFRAPDWSSHFGKVDDWIGTLLE
jgi:glycosyltransferase involved in cell wall biosynthesis